MTNNYDCIAVGGGPASFFALLQLKQQHPTAKVLIVEKQHRALEKIYLSGGGRCNLTHACFDPKILSQFYPRGSKELRGAFYHFQPSDTMAWFEDHGVRLKTENDGRVFPVSDRSESVADALLKAAKTHTIPVWTQTEVMQVTPKDQGFSLTLHNEEILFAKCLLFGSGGNRKTLKLIEKMGISVFPPVPSLFSFLIEHPILNACVGTPISNVRIGLSELPFTQQGSMMITHEGLSGPAVLKLSAFSARELANRDYQQQLLVDWVPALNHEQVREKLTVQKTKESKKSIGGSPAFDGIPKKVWEALLKEIELESSLQWSQLSKVQMQNLIQILKETKFEIQGKSLHKQEFVTCGGVDLKKIDFRTMQSKEMAGLFFAGEVLDIDGVTGGFNLQNTWTTGYIAGNGMATLLR